MKKSISILLSILTLISAVTCIDFSIYAAGVPFISSSSSFNPIENEYVVDAQSSQFDFFENYTTVEGLKSWASSKGSFVPNKDIFSIYADKIGITKNGRINTNLSDYQKVAKIYYFMSKTLKSSGSETVDPSTLLISKSGHCEAFTDVFGELCKKAGIEHWQIGTTGHEWNIVKVDGKYYECDPMNDIVFMGNMDKVINTYASSWITIRNYDGSEHYEGNGAIKKMVNKVQKQHFYLRLCFTERSNQP